MKILCIQYFQVVLHHCNQFVYSHLYFINNISQQDKKQQQIPQKMLKKIHSLSHALVLQIPFPPHSSISFLYSPFSSQKLKQIYQQIIQKQNMTKDIRQLQVINDLQRLHDDLVMTHGQWKKYAQGLTDGQGLSGDQEGKREAEMERMKQREKEKDKEEKKKGFFSFFSKEFSTARSVRVKGLYLYGGSGSGKSFLSDIFYNNLPIEQKKKMHFHQFMASIHAQLFLLQKQKKGYNPLSIVAQRNAKKTRLLYLDQFQVTDVADASILKRLFQRLINNELVLLATTNRPPFDLYKQGHQREFFLPFIHFIQQQCTVKNINSLKDYRYELERDQTQKYQTYINIPSNSPSLQPAMKKLLSALTGQTNPYFTSVPIEPIPGRTLIVPRACNLVCVYNFEELMESTMGDIDYRAICKKFKAIVIRGVRSIRREERNMANRLIKLFDQAYFRSVKIYIQADVGIDQLIKMVQESQAVTQEDFAMIRCKSRLMEFQTISYQEKLSYIQQKMQKQKNSQEVKSKQNKSAEQNPKPEHKK